MFLIKKHIMKKIVSLIVLCISLNNVLAKKNSAPAEIINEFDAGDNITDIYTFRYIVPKKIHREEIADFDEDGNLVLDGVYSKVGSDGYLNLVAYHSDKNGYYTYDIANYEDDFRFCPPNVVASCLG